MITFRPLASSDFPNVHSAFLDAFGDYEVPFRISREELFEMINRRGYVPELSVGVWDDSKLVAFTLNGAGRWNGLKTAYDTGTGVVPSHRGRGLSRTMLQESIRLLRERAIEQYLLEVLQNNTKAYNLYASSGFQVTRELQCWKFEGGGGLPARHRIEQIDDTGEFLERTADWKPAAPWCDIAPSWQNSDDSIARAREPRHILVARHGSEVVGYAVVFPSNGDLPQLAVAPDFRRKGVGRELLTGAAAAAGGSLRIINVDPRDAGVEHFLAHCGANPTVRQYEMSLLLTRIGDA